MIVFLFLVLSINLSIDALCHTKYEFKCDNLTCIDAAFRCDKEKDCKNGEDEKDCHRLNYCARGFLPCLAGGCYSKIAKCNYIWDCSDGSDEHGCTKPYHRFLSAGIGTSNSFLVGTYREHDYSSCEYYGKYECNNGQCIDADFRCDKENDCKNGEDEKNCSYFHHCPGGMFMCKDGSCILKEYRCNGKKECMDGSDERHCKKDGFIELASDFRLTIACDPQGDFMCNNGTCIISAFRCDKYPDCADGEDEQDCHETSTCPPGHIMCRNGGCPPKAAKCNGIWDCSDGSDEHGCHKTRKHLDAIKYPLPSPSVTLSRCLPGIEFECKNKTCIDADFRCDKHNDCLEGEDELNCYYYGHCATNMFACNNGNCVPKSALCNKVDDCLDESDERVCKKV